MRKPLIIGMAGRKGSGKDFGADILQKVLIEQYSKTVDTAAFADHMKRMLETGLDLAPFQLEDHDAKEAEDPRYGVSPRKMMQTLGTEWGRNLICDDLWLRCMDNTISKSKADVIIITDVRFPNEAGFIRSRGGEIVHVFNLQQPDSVDLHQSEQPLPMHGRDFVAVNDMTAEYEVRLRTVLHQIANPVDWKISQRVGVKPMSETRAGTLLDTSA
ncbi:deoxynucleotide monophosphate kinase family protein [Alteromonas sp. RKMC-009]|uniref:deoxynucleotide monophosphate kinase family protein n=1 Tax=Alteromonas sp. RKMC-009 TaxID=2267264 RepID=UPI000E685A47|nr:deoxynucleotide monophosphate kinase [Alteromonas sp. RKMC-009]AYA64284.1 deoxynucleotide monophosphate kinase [Alteromonas sp. RKMC-009]